MWSEVSGVKPRGAQPDGSIEVVDGPHVTRAGPVTPPATGRTGGRLIPVRGVGGIIAIPHACWAFALARHPLKSGKS